MLFRRTAAVRPDATTVVSSVAEDTPVQRSGPGSAPLPPFDIAPLLDAFGQVLSAYAQGSFDLPDLSSSQASEELDRWRRHAVLGVPFGAQSSGMPTLSAAERDYRGAARSLTDHRRREKRYVESALSDLRDALWACVERVHTVAQADLQADDATSVQITRVQSAIHGLETGSVKHEVMQAISAITDIARHRRDTQHAAYGLLADRIDQLGSQLEEAKRDSETDALTALGNRKRFERAAQRAVQIHTLNRVPMTLVMLDLDYLKRTNDQFGHAAGDCALQQVASSLSKVFLRNSDVLCRLGGDEFAVILPNTDAAVAERLTGRLLHTVRGLCPAYGPNAPRMSASVGYAAYRAGEGVEGWAARADGALYAAKGEGRGTARAAA